MSIYPPMLEVEAASLEEYNHVYRVYLLSMCLAGGILLWDFVSNISRERILVWRPPQKGLFGYSFLFSRYFSLVWMLFIGINAAGVSFNSNWCRFSRIWPIGVTLTLITAHIVLAIRVYSIWGRSKKMAWFLGGLLVSTFVVEIAADLFIQPTLLVIDRTGKDASTVCFLQPSATVFSLAFILPSITGHVLLILTLLKSVPHIRLGQSALMKALQKDQFFFVFLTCLANFSNVVLVLQPNDFRFKLVNMLPSLVATQVLLARIVFNVKEMTNNGSAGLIAIDTSAFTRPTLMPMSNFDSYESSAAAHGGRYSYSKTSSAGSPYSEDRVSRFSRPSPKRSPPAYESYPSTPSAIPMKALRSPASPSRISPRHYFAPKDSNELGVEVYNHPFATNPAHALPSSTAAPISPTSMSANHSHASTTQRTLYSSEDVFVLEEKECDASVRLVDIQLTPPKADKEKESNRNQASIALVDIDLHTPDALHGEEYAELAKHTLRSNSPDPSIVFPLVSP